MRRALLKVGYRCNNSCVFCHSFYLRSIPALSAPQLFDKIDRAAAAGCEMVVLSGGEPMIRSDLIDAAARCQKKGLKLGLVTNGRMLFYRDLLDRLIDSGLSYVYVSLHGADRVTHNFLTGADSFRQTVSGIINASRAGLHPTINTVVSRRNIGELNAIVDLLCGIGHLKVKFSMIEPRGLAKENFPQIVPGLRETAAAVSAAISYGLDRYGERDVEFAHDAIPFCLICEYVSFYDDLYTNQIFLMSEADEPGLHPVDYRNRGWSPRCLRCSLRGVCLGPYREYLARAGDSELQPIVEQRSNAFLLRDTGYTFVPPRKGCPDEARRACDELSIMLAAGRKGAQIWRADTRDFSAPQVIETIKTSQVFAEKNGRPVTLKPVRRCAECGACAGIFEPVKPREVNIKAIAQAAVALRGRVLDVGCGEALIWPKIAPLVQSGRIEYHAVDPDPAVVDRLTRRSRHVAGHITRIEDFCGEPSYFDACLMLGSINHVQDIDRALCVVRDAIRPGGQLIVSDDVPHAVIAREAPPARAEFEHYRNLSADGAATLIKDLGFEIVRVLPVTAQTEHRWVIFARKPGDVAPPARSTPARRSARPPKPAPRRPPPKKRRAAKAPVKRPLHKAPKKRPAKKPARRR